MAAPALSATIASPIAAPSSEDGAGSATTDYRPSNPVAAPSAPATPAPDTTTAEIPSSIDPGTRAAPADATAASHQESPTSYDDGVIRYEHAKDSEINGPPIGSLDDFMSEGDITSPLGIEVREDKRRIKAGGEAQGLLIVDVFAGSAAARAGLHPYHRAMRDALETAAVAGAMFCPPAVLLVPVFDQVWLGESYDLIIGVDGARVTNFLDFQDRLRDVQAGEIVYFSIIRNGERKQIPVPVPETLTGPTF